MRHTLIILVLLAAFVIPLFGFAQPVLPPEGVGQGLVPCKGTSDSPCTFCHFFILIHNIFDFLALKVAPALSVAMLIAGGLILMFTGGFGGTETRPGPRALGMRIVRGAIIGLVIVLLSWVIVNTTINTIAGFGVESDVAGQPPGFPWPWNTPPCGI